MGIGRDFDRAQIRDAKKEAFQMAGQTVIVRKFTGSTPGDPIRGIQPTYQFEDMCAKAIIQMVGQSDVLVPGGIAQLGDIQVQISVALREVTDKTGNVGDYLIWQGTQYRVVGKGKPIIINGKTHYYSYTMRKMENL